MAEASIVSHGKEICLLLLGKTGHGKSATANTILESKSFEKSDDMSSKTKSATLNCSLRDDGTVVRVVDAPGVMDTGKQEESIIAEIMEGMSLCPKGFHALVFVIKVGIGYTKEERESLETLKKYFGSNFLKDFGIVVMTHGDSLDINHEEDGITFEDWLSANERELLNEFNNRIVLFYNSGEKYIDKRKIGVEKLFELVEEIPKVYTSDHIKLAREAREKIVEQLEASTVSHGKEICLLLLGKTGHGKSSTGNTILESKSFEKSDDMSSKTKSATLNCSLKDDGTVVRVVDAPGVMDTDKQEESIIAEIMEGMSLCPKGFHALVFVIKVGIRYTKEEKESLETLKKYFGSNFLKDFGIVVMTHGDSFDINHEEDGITFEDWLSANERELLKEFNNRNVLFYNSGEMYIDKRQKGLKKLFELVEEIPKVYTSDHIKLAREAREKIVEQLDEPVLYANIQEKLSLLIEQIEKDLRNDTFSYEFMLKKIEDLNEEIERMGKKFNKSLKFSYFKEQLDAILMGFDDIKIKVKLKQRKELQRFLKDLTALRRPPAELQIALSVAYTRVARFFLKFGSRVTFGSLSLLFKKSPSNPKDVNHRKRATRVLKKVP